MIRTVIFFADIVDYDKEPSFFFTYAVDYDKELLFSLQI